jgi:hypothetical protein
MSMLKGRRDLLSAFNAEGVECLVIGGHAVGVHAEPRATKDLEVLVRNDCGKLRAGVSRATEVWCSTPRRLHDDFCGHPEDVFQIGVPPSRVDILQRISGVDFEGAWERRTNFKGNDELEAPFIAVGDLIANKIASGRLQDLADA